MSCEKAPETEKQNLQNTEKKAVVEKFVNVSSKISNFRARTGTFTYSPFSRKRQSEVSKKAAQKRMHLKGTTDDRDTTNWGDWDNWQSCAEITTYINDEGFFVTVMDYGTEGCEEFGTLIKGKITTMYRDEDTGFAWREYYENYHIFDMGMNGSMISECTWSNDGMEEYTSHSQEDITISYDDGETFSFQSDFSDIWSANSYSILSGSNYNFASGTETFTYEVTKTTVYNWECGWDIIVPVTGTEEMTYVNGDVNDSYIFDYGDGTCDNLVSVTYNGETEIIDFGDLWGDDDWTDPNEPSDQCMVYFWSYQESELGTYFMAETTSYDENITYTWNFGDGTTGEGTELSHEYAATGTYLVTLSADLTDCGTVTYTDSVYVVEGDDDHNGNCQAYFYYYPVSDAFMNFAFIANSLGDAASYTWDFGDGTTATGLEAEHEYSEAGEYTVTLTSTSDCGELVYTEVVTAGEQSDPNSDCQNYFVHYANSNTLLDFVFLANYVGDDATFSWNFGDGTSGTGGQVEHSYSEAGEYTVTLTANSTDCGELVYTEVITAGERDDDSGNGNNASGR